jgi:hypothetical protein
MVIRIYRFAVPTAREPVFNMTPSSEALIASRACISVIIIDYRTHNFDIQFKSVLYYLWIYSGEGEMQHRYCTSISEVKVRPSLLISTYHQLSTLMVMQWPRLCRSNKSVCHVPAYLMLLGSEGIVHIRDLASIDIEVELF